MLHRAAAVAAAVAAAATAAVAARVEADAAARGEQHQDERASHAREYVTFEATAA